MLSTRPLIAGAPLVTTSSFVVSSSQRPGGLGMALERDALDDKHQFRCKAWGEGRVE